MSKKKVFSQILEKKSPNTNFFSEFGLRIYESIQKNVLYSKKNINLNCRYEKYVFFGKKIVENKFSLKMVIFKVKFSPG